MKSICFGIAVALFCLAAHGAAGQAQSSADDAATTPARIGRWTARFLRGGLFLDFDGIPLIKGGVVQLFSADNSRGYYGSGSNPPTVTTEDLPNGRAYVAEYRYSSEGNSFAGTQRIEVRADNTVRLTMRAKWEGPAPAQLEWNAARIWAYPLLGATYEAVPSGVSTDQAIMKGAIPLHARAGSAVANRIAEGWSQLRLQLPVFGELTFTSESGATGGPVLLDGRNDPYLKNDRLFWLGFSGATLMPGQDQVLDVTVTLAPKAGAPPPQHTATSITVPATVRSIKIAEPSLPPLDDSGGRPIIIPQPKHVAFSEDCFLLKGRQPLTVALPPDEPGQRAARAVRELAEELSARTTVRWSEQPIDAGKEWSRRGVLVTTMDAPNAPHPFSPALALQPEGYALVVTSRFVAIVGRDSAGAFYGLQTLRQLLRTDARPPHPEGARNPDGEGLAGPTPGTRRPITSTPHFVGADITDWPSLRMRAVHLFVGKEALPFHKKLIDRIFSRYKLNTLVIECEYAKWASHPEIWQPYSMDPEDLRQEIAYARDRFMEPIPLINSLGHSEWIFKNGQHLDLAEDVSSPHAYDASNPESYRFIFSIFGEAIDLFRPRYFHIGHDEVKVPSYDQFGKYPARPQNIEKGATALFMEDTNRLSDWLRAKGVMPILWADMLLSADEGDPTVGRTMTAANAPTAAEAEKRRSLLPKDAVIADWRYEPGSEQRNGLGIFRALGHDVIGSAWYAPENIRGWAHAAIKSEALGTLQTTWAGYDSKESLLDEEYKQFTAFVLAGEYAWSGTELHPRPDTADTVALQADLLPYNASDVFARSYAEAPEPLKKRKQWAVDLHKAANIALATAADSGQFIERYDARRLRAVKAPPAGPEPDQQQPQPRIPGRGHGVQMQGIMLRGQLGLASNAEEPNGKQADPPDSIAIPIGASARELVFTHAMLNGIQNGAAVATYLIVYADRTKVTIPIRSGREIWALDDGSLEQSISTTRRPDVPSGAFLTDYRWRNPHPELVIEQIQLRTDSPLASPILFGIRGQE